MFYIYIDMKFASFDVGIKNMAYCIFDCSGTRANIVEWNVINLMDKEVKHICNQTTKNKICKKKAVYRKGNLFFCNKHAEKSDYFLPNTKFSYTNLKKLKKDELILLGTSQLISFDVNENKDKILEDIFTFYNSKSLEEISKKKQKASEVNLVVLGRKIKEEFNKIDNLQNLDKVVIENQISPIATRMKTIQGMLAQYFIMNYENIQIDFLASSGKLKGFAKMNENENSEYKQHKKDAIFYCRQFLEKEEYKDWKFILDNDKKDDLADCFLQGIWYFNEKMK